MIVRNEAAILGRCLDSALPVVDAYVVCDTGSTDGTLAVVAESAGRHGTPGVVLHHPWRDFGHNRTRAAHEARRWALAQGWPAHRTYLLFLDADMVLRHDDAFDPDALTATWYDVIQDDGVMRYANVRLACLSHEWEAVGPTHEYWRPLGAGPTCARLDVPEIDDVGDGSGKARKYARDIQLLRRALVAEPDNPRHTFYLGQSYFDIGRWGMAASWYARRRRRRGWDEERWYAGYRQGVALLRLGDTDRGAGVLLAAFDERPTRAEPLWALARHYGERGMHHSALLLAQRGVEVPYPDGDALFVETGVYAWQLWEEVMLHAHHAGPAHRALGLAACERLLAHPGHEPWFYDGVARNATFYRPASEPAEAVACP